EVHVYEYARKRIRARFPQVEEMPSSAEPTRRPPIRPMMPSPFEDVFNTLNNGGAIGASLPIQKMAYNPATDRIALLMDQQVSLWDPHSGDLLWKLPLDTDGPSTAVAFSEKGDRLAVGDEGGNVLLIELPDVSAAGLAKIVDGR
ncbi:MAG: hypothetical protein AAGG44_12545, partial [Planctomycetota bacterium]